MDPAREASERLLREAYRAFVLERYLTAVRFFERFLEDVPESPRVPEARWWLARSLEQLGDVRGAVGQYRMLADLPSGPVIQGYGGHARRRLEQLGYLRGEGFMAPKQVALRIQDKWLPPKETRGDWLRSLAQAGVTSLLIEPARQTELALDARLPDEWADLLLEGHRCSLRFWIALDIHRWGGESVNREWAVVTDGSGPAADTRLRPDVTHPDFQAYVERLAGRLARDGVDGLLLRARTAPGFGDEYSQGSYQVFAESFGVATSPQEVLLQRKKEGGTADTRTTDYWRWVGWKAGRHAALADRLHRAMRQSNPLAVLLVEVHGEAAGAPLEALQRYGEDLAELARTGVEIVVFPDTSEADRLADRLGRQGRGADRVWTTRTVETAGRSFPMEPLKQLIAAAREGTRWNVVVDSVAPSAVP